MASTFSELLRDASVARRECNAFERLTHLTIIYAQRAVPVLHHATHSDIEHEDDGCLDFFPRIDAKHVSRWMMAVGEALAVIDESNAEMASHYECIFLELYCNLVPRTAAFERPGNRAKHAAARRHIMRSVYEATRGWPVE